MSIDIAYRVSLKKTETKKFELPDLKSSHLFLKSFEVVSDVKSIEIKISANDKNTIIAYGEAVFHKSTDFDLSEKISSIIDADALYVTVRNLCSTKETNVVNVKIIFRYAQTLNNLIVYNNMYNNLTPDILPNILSDIHKCGKHITKIIWTSPNRIGGLELVPQFESNPSWLVPIKEFANEQNQIIMDLTDSKRYDPNLINQLKYYNLVVPDNVEKLGVIVYGFSN
jgi:hypothetical protein